MTKFSCTLLPILLYASFSNAAISTHIPDLSKAESCTVYLNNSDDAKILVCVDKKAELVVGGWNIVDAGNGFSEVQSTIIVGMKNAGLDMSGAGNGNLYFVRK